MYRGVAICSPIRGDTIDDLIDGAIQAEVYPNFFGFAKDPKISLWKLRQADDLLSCFRIPMTRSAHNELLLLQQFIASLPADIQNEYDTWNFIWGQHFYSPSKFYQHHLKDLHTNRSITWI
jgi:hypothetical protein